MGAIKKLIGAHLNSDVGALAEMEEEILHPSLTGTDKVADFRFNERGRGDIGKCLVKNQAPVDSVEHGVIVGSDYYADFDGVSGDIITVSDDSSLSPVASDFTISAWILTRDLATQNQKICCKLGTGTGLDKEYTFELLTTGGLTLVTSSGGSTWTSGGIDSETGVILENVWYHVVCVKSGTGATFYLNGVALAEDVGSGTIDATLYDGTGTFKIGGSGSGTNDWNGGIYDLRFYNGTAFTATQVATAFKEDVYPTTNLKAYWKLNEVNFPTDNALDSSGTGNDGTVTSATSTQGAPSYPVTSVVPTPNVSNYYAKFDALDDQIVVSDHSSIQDIFDGSGGQIGAWINPLSSGENDGSGGYILSKINGLAGWGLRTVEQASGMVKLDLFYGCVTTDAIYETTSEVVRLGVWTFVCLEFDADDMVNNSPTIYLWDTFDGFRKISEANGLLTVEQAGSGLRDSDVGESLYIGDSSAGTRCFDGGIFNAFLISTGNGETLLTEAQLETLATTGNYSDYSFTALYALDESSGTYANTGVGGAGVGTGTNVAYQLGRPDLTTDTDARISFAKENCIEFDGIDDVVNIGSNADIDNIFAGGGTMACWIYPRAFGGDMFNKGRTQFDIVSGTGDLGNLRFVRRRGSGNWANYTDTNDNIPLYKWTRVVVTADEDDLDAVDAVKFYVNGVLSGSGAVSLSGTADTDAAQVAGIGAASSGVEPFDGFISDFVIANGSRWTAQQVSDDYNHHSLDYENMTRWYKLNETNFPTDNAVDSASAVAGTVTGALSATGAPQYNPKFYKGMKVGNGIDTGGVGAFNKGVTSAIPMQFGTGSVDNPFSIFSTVYMRDATKFRIANVDPPVGGTDRIMIFSTSATDYLVLALFDTNVVSISETSDATLTAYENQWVTLCCTYDGSAHPDGITLYVNGVAVASTGADNVSYVAIPTTTLPLSIGHAPIVPDSNVGIIDNLQIFNTEKTASDVADYHNLMSKGW